MFKFNPNEYNIVSIMQGGLNIIAVVLIAGGLLRILLGKGENDDPKVVSGIVMTVIGLVLASTTKILIGLGILG